MRSKVLTREVMELNQRFSALDSEQQALFLDLVDPQPEEPAKPKPKRKAKGKSPRASSLADAIKPSPKPREPICATCGNVEDYVDHSEPSPSYHAFQSAKAAGAGGD